jgi:hypothetical protein
MILLRKKMKLKFNDNLLTILLEKEEKVEEMLKSLIFDKLDFKKGVFSFCYRYDKRWFKYT